MSDQPVPSHALLGVVTEYLSQGEWRALEESAVFGRDRRRTDQILEWLLCLCIQIDIRLAGYAAKALIRVARWRRRLVIGPGRTS